MKKLLVLFILCSSVIIKAQTFRASVQSSTVSAGENFRVSFEFSGSDVNGIKNFRAPGFKGLNVLSGPNQSTSMQIINGVMSGSVGFSYYLQADNPGNYTIDEATINYKGKTYRTSRIQIKVIKGSVQPSKRGSVSASNQNISQNIFIRAIADKNRVYKGEQVNVTYKLYTRMNFASPQISKLPGYQGFWAEEIESPTTINFTSEQFDGKTYNVAVIKRAALFPTQSGDLYVTPFEMNIPVVVPEQRRRGDIFDEFFNDPFFTRTKTIDYHAKSNAIKVHVLPLPSSGIPGSFKGVVGDYSINAYIDKKSTRTNEPVTLKLNITGYGNINLLDLPEIPIPAGVEKYDPKTSVQLNKTGRVSGTKTAEYIIIPRYEGQITIPSLEFSFFSPSKKRYITLNTEPIKINVEKGNSTYAYGSGSGKEDIRLLGEDIRFIKTSADDLNKTGDYLVGSIWFWIASLLPITGLVVLYYSRRKNEILENDIQLSRFLKAEKKARRFLSEAQKALQRKEQEAFYSGVSAALFGYIQDKFHIPMSEFTIDRSIEELRRKMVPEDSIQKVAQALTDCEFARFAPSGEYETSMQQMYDRAAGIIIELENSCKS